MPKQSSAPSPEDSAKLALAALTFLAEDGPRLGRFLALTGIGPEDLRAVADAPETLIGVLDHVLADESLLLVFAASKGISPEVVSPARAALARALGSETTGD